MPQRTDISLDSPQGRELAIADNRAGELNLSWDYSQLLDMHDDDEINLNDWWTGDELDAMMPQELPTEDPEDANAVAEAQEQTRELWEYVRGELAA